MAVRLFLYDLVKACVLYGLMARRMFYMVDGHAFV